MKMNPWRMWAAMLMRRVPSQHERLRENDVQGNVSVFAYALAADLPTGREPCGKVGNLCRSLCRERGIRIGLVRQQTGDRDKRSLVSTFPPIVLGEAWRHFGFAHAEPSLGEIELRWKPLLSIYHRLNSRTA